jgi:hypothetical protein
VIQFWRSDIYYILAHGYHDSRYHRPSIERLVNDTLLRAKAYAEKDPWIADKLLDSYDNNNPVNVFPARKMRFVHRITLFFSYWTWFFILFSFIWWDKRHK